MDEDGNVGNWKKSVAIGTGVAVAAMVTAPLVLTAVGFTSTGVAAGSVAAGVQSSVYGGAATGVFSVLQSAGAAGLAGKTLAGIGALAGSAAGVQIQNIKPDLFHYRALGTPLFTDKKSVAIGTGVGVGAMVTAPLVLPAVGFTSTGVAAGSVAAGVQSSVYGGAATGVFSVLQSAGAAGLAGKTLAGIGALAGSATGYFTKD